MLIQSFSNSSITRISAVFQRNLNLKLKRVMNARYIFSSAQMYFPLNLASQHTHLAIGPQKFFTTSSIAKPNKEAVDYFLEGFDKLKSRKAFAHPLFKTMTARAKEGTLTAEQYSIFLMLILARVFRTMPSIATHARYALLNADYKMFATVFQNLKEEGGDGNISKMHPLLAEQAFNEISRHFGLPYVTMKQAFDKLSNESFALKHYADVIDSIYSKNPAFASLAQETASGGNGKTGMMADLYEFFTALRPQINPERFEKFVLPYFKEHLSLSADGSYRDDATEGIECQHASRALEDVLEKITDINITKQGLSTMTEFVEAQEKLFDETLNLLSK